MDMRFVSKEYEVYVYSKNAKSIEFVSDGITGKSLTILRMKDDRVLVFNDSDTRIDYLTEYIDVHREHIYTHDIITINYHSNSGIKEKVSCIVAKNLELIDINGHNISYIIGQSGKVFIYDFDYRNIEIERVFFK